MDRIRMSRALVLSLVAVACAVPPTMQAADAPSPASVGGTCPPGHQVPDVDVDSGEIAQGDGATASAPAAGGTTVRAGRRLGGTWRTLPKSPFASVHPAVAWADDVMVAFDPRSGRTATYDPRERAWVEHQPLLPDAIASEALHPGHALTWSGDEMVVFGSMDGPAPVRLVGHAFDPERGRWRDIAEPPVAPGGSAVAWTGALLLAVTSERSAAYDPVADCWIAMPDVPLPQTPENARTWRAMDWEVRSVHWTGEELVAVMASQEPHVPMGVVSFVPDTWAWSIGPQGPLASCCNEAFWAAGKLWFLGDDPHNDDVVDATFDPSTDAWEALDIACPIDSDRATWTGALFMEPYFMRVAFDPVSGSCSATPTVDDRPRSGVQPIWTGRELIVWSGAYGDAFRAPRDGLAYRPPRSALGTGSPGAQRLGKRLLQAIRVRRDLRMDTDPDVVRAILADPINHRPTYGMAMTAAELQARGLANDVAYRSGSLRDWLRKQPTFAGLWVDHRVSGLGIALTEADPAVIAEIDSFMERFTMSDWRLEIRPTSRRDLIRAFRRAGAVSKSIDPTARLVVVGMDESEGQVNLVYEPGTARRIRQRKSALERGLGVPVRIAIGVVRDA